MSLTVGSLFTGCGGMDLGLEQAGLTCAFQVEIDPDARAVLEHRWPDTRRHDDARTFPPTDPGEWRCDLLAGGDPCQENSRARVTVGTRAPSLGAEFLRIVDALRPRLVLRENPTRSRPDAPWPWWRFRNELEDRVATVLPFRLRSCCFGADHQRDRLFLLAEQANPFGESIWLSGRGADAGAPRALEAAARERERLRPHPGAVGGCTGHRADTRDGGGDARIPRGVDRLRMLGNAVDVRVARFIGETMMRSLEAAG